MEMTREKIRNFKREFEENTKILAEKYDIKIELGNIRFDSQKFSTRMTCTNLGESSEKKVDTYWFSVLKTVFGFEGNIGDSYRGLNGVVYTVVNLDDKKRKYPVILRGSDGKQYKNTVASVNSMLKHYGIPSCE